MESPSRWMSIRSDAGGKDMLHEAGLAGPQKTAEKIN